MHVFFKKKRNLDWLVQVAFALGIYQRYELNIVLDDKEGSEGLYQVEQG